ncbi:MAG: hypothetical protein KF726_11965 [Anaerolineae bacterium]|nr:hypothetical protein [Anaerolineae bacterium]
MTVRGRWWNKFVPLFVVLILLTITACAPERRQIPTITPVVSDTPEPTVTPIPTATLIIPTAPSIIVTLTPRATETMIPTATLPYEILDYNGNWVLTIRIEVLGDPQINEVRYTGTGRLSTNLNGRIIGNISFAALAFDQPPCRVVIPESKTYDAGLSGMLRLAEDGRVYADLTISPIEPNRVTPFDIYCAQGDITRYEANLLWATLDAVHGMQLTLPFEQGYTDVSLADLTGPGRGVLYGSAQIETTLNR